MCIASFICLLPQNVSSTLYKTQYWITQSSFNCALYVRVHTELKYKGKNTHTAERPAAGDLIRGNKSTAFFHELNHKLLAAPLYVCFYPKRSAVSLWLHGRQCISWKLSIAYSVYWLCYGFENRGIMVRFSAGVQDFYLLQRVQTGPYTHPSSYLVINRDYFTLGKASWPSCWHSPPSSTDVIMSGANLHAPTLLHYVNRDNFTSV
jgi:hypothetical protein